MTSKLGQQAFEKDAAQLKTIMGGPQFLRSPLSSGSWDGDSYSDTAATLIDLSAVFGAPAGIKAVKVRVLVRDSGASGAAAYLTLSPSDVNVAMEFRCPPEDDYWAEYLVDVPCDANGDVYYTVEATGASTLDAHIQIWGYWI